MSEPEAADAPQDHGLQPMDEVIIGSNGLDGLNRVVKLGSIHTQFEAVEESLMGNPTLRVPKLLGCVEGHSLVIPLYKLELPAWRSTMFVGATLKRVSKRYLEINDQFWGNERATFC